MELIEGPNVSRVGFFKAFWNAGRDIILGLVGGLIGALCGIYLFDESLFPTVIIVATIFGITLFFMYLSVRENIPF